ncbi:MAG: helix-turn-helix transcriptional regulator [Clostridiales bacterium]|nr:helix-turn-helix transcriptional regulator [Clostridiales bacterium]
MMLSDKLKELRKENSLTQQDLANILDVTKGAIAMWETNKRTPDAETLLKLADVFSVSVDYLLDRETDSEEILKLALFNGAEGITDEMYDEVKQFAEMVKLREFSKEKDN